jgi:peptidoglycan L-alanyl-D-glutamate endopeptidase CwlK
MLLALACYFLLFAALAALLLFEPARAATARMAGRLGVRARQVAHHSARRLAQPPRLALRWGGDAGAWLHAQRRLLAMALVLVLLPSIAVFMLQRRPVFDLVEGAAPDPHIAQLLMGEQLTPPPSLPPDIFTTREVELVRPATAWASRDWELLDTTFRQRLLTVFKLMREQHGYEMVLLEGYRSPERQAALHALGSHVTGAEAGMSYHQHGLAADSAFLRDGQLVISERDPWAMRGYQLYGELAAAAGLTWGGQWRIRDFGHVELRRPGVLARHAG